MNGANWTELYPRSIEEAARIKGAAILDGEVVCLDDKDVSQFDTLHSRTADKEAVACAFDLLMRDGDDLRGPATYRAQGGSRQSDDPLAWRHSSTSNRPKGTATKCLRRSATWGLRALFQRSSTRPIV